MKQAFVTFYSPGTFVHEETTQPITEWDIEQAKQMALSVVERYNATPFGFRFSLYEREDNELNSRETKRSPMYFLGGQVMTLDEIKARSDPSDEILIANMEANGWDKVIFNFNSWKSVHPLMPDDVVLDYTPSPADPSSDSAEGA